MAGTLVCAVALSASWLLLRRPATPFEAGRLGVLVVGADEAATAAAAARLGDALRPAAPLFGGRIEVRFHAPRRHGALDEGRAAALAERFDALVLALPPDAGDAPWSLFFRLPPATPAGPRPDLERLTSRMAYPRWVSAAPTEAEPDLPFLLIKAHLLLADGIGPGVEGLLLASKGNAASEAKAPEADYALGSFSLAASVIAGPGPPLVDYAIERLGAAHEALDDTAPESPIAESAALNLASALLLRGRPGVGSAGDLARALWLLEPLRQRGGPASGRPVGLIADYLTATARLMESPHPHSPQDPASLALRALEGPGKAWTRDGLPYAWASAQVLRARALMKARDADKADIEAAIQATEAALGVMTRNPYPGEWAEAHGLLGSLYARRATGDRAANLAEARAHYDAALAVWTPEAAPEAWARALAGRASILLQLSRAPSDELTRQALEDGGAALEAVSVETSPETWASIHDLLGVASRRRAEGRDADLLRNAIGHFRAALEVRVPQRYPVECAKTLSNLGNAYRDLPGPDRRHTLSLALQAYDAALEALEFGTDGRIRLQIESLRAQAEQERRALPDVEGAGGGELETP